MFAAWLESTRVRPTSGTMLAVLHHAARSRVCMVRGGLLVACAFAMLVPCTGCGNKRLDVNPVRGKVVYNGQGVPQAIVTLFPIDATDERAKKMRPFAYAGFDGQFEIKTYIDGDGAPPGKYRVSVMVPVGAPRGSKDRRVDGPTDPSGPKVNVPPAIVTKYANVDTAGIEVEIQDGENNLAPFELKM
jgi:hypothetical protein